MPKSLMAFYRRLRAANRALGCDFFEGVVMKREDSIYPVQLWTAMEECRGGSSTGSSPDAAGKTKAEFFRDEQAALEPWQPGLFDDLAGD